MNHTIPLQVQQLAERATVENPECHVGIINTVVNWHVAGALTHMALQAEFERLAQVDDVDLPVCTMWSHPPMVTA